MVVFNGFEDPPGTTGALVDVFSATGAHLFSGVTTRPNWFAAVGDHVYYFGVDERAEERTVVRALIQEPFE